MSVDKNLRIQSSRLFTAECNPETEVESFLLKTSLVRPGISADAYERPVLVTTTFSKPIWNSRGGRLRDELRL